MHSAVSLQMSPPSPAFIPISHIMPTNPTHPSFSDFTWSRNSGKLQHSRSCVTPEHLWWMPCHSELHILCFSIRAIVRSFNICLVSAIRKTGIWKSLSISCIFPKTKKFQEIVELPRKFLVTSTNNYKFLRRLRNDSSFSWFSNKQFLFLWFYFATYNYVCPCLKCHAWCKRTATGKWTSSSCEPQFV